MKNMIFLMLLTFSVAGAAQQRTNKNARYTIDVNGNCEQCKKRIEKAAYSVPGVKMALWDVESHKLNLILNEEKTSVEMVSESVAKAGYDAGSVKSTDENYSKLPSCCLYERKK